MASHFRHLQFRFSCPLRWLLHLSCSKGNQPRLTSHPVRGLLPLDHPCLPNQVEESRGGRSGPSRPSGRSGDAAGFPVTAAAKAARWFATRMEKSGLKANAAKLKMIGFEDGGARGLQTKIQNISKLLAVVKLLWTLVPSVWMPFLSMSGILAFPPQESISHVSQLLVMKASS